MTSIIAEPFTNFYGKVRWRIVYMGLGEGILNGTPGISRSLKTWASKAGALRAANRKI
jgi:hypothetical protein